MRKAILTMAACATLLWVGTAQATDEEKCLAGRAKAKGKYEQCVGKWLSKGYGGGGFDQAKLSKCREKYAARWAKLQGLTGSTTCLLPRVVDNGATVTDNLTGLVWEKKTTLVGSGTNFGGDAGDVDNYYAWTNGDGDFTDGDGLVYTDFLTNKNAGGGFASANDWRLPTLAELMTLVNQPYPCAPAPCVDAAFGATQSDYYWSATTSAGFPFGAWSVFFDGGTVLSYNKPNSGYARAVRGGL